MLGSFYITGITVGVIVSTNLVYKTGIATMSKTQFSLLRSCPGGFGVGIEMKFCSWWLTLFHLLCQSDCAQVSGDVVLSIPLARAWTWDVSGFCDFSWTVDVGLCSKFCRMCDASAAHLFRLIQFLFLQILAGSMPHKTGSRYVGLDLIHLLMSLKHFL